MAANCALYPHNWAVWGGFNKINKLTGRPPPAQEVRGGQSLTKDQFVIAWRRARRRARRRAPKPQAPVTLIFNNNMGYQTVAHAHCQQARREDGLKTH